MLEFYTPIQNVSPFSISPSMYFRSTLCAFQSLPWCGAAVCDPISRLCAWTNAGVISVGYISIFITVIWIFALPLWYHCTRFMWRIWLEDVCQDLTSRGAQTHVILGHKYEISGEKTDLNLVIWSLHITHVIFSHHGWSRSLSSFSHEEDKHCWRFMEEVNLPVMGYWFLWMYFPQVISPKENSSPSDALFVTGL